MQNITLNRTVKSSYNLFCAELQCILIILQSTAIEKTFLLLLFALSWELGHHFSAHLLCPPFGQTPACTNCMICTAIFTLCRLHTLNSYLQTCIDICKLAQCTHIPNLHTYLQTSTSHSCKVAHSFSHIRLIWSTSHFVAPMHVLFCIECSTVCTAVQLCRENSYEKSSRPNTLLWEEVLK